MKRKWKIRVSRDGATQHEATMTTGGAMWNYAATQCETTNQEAILETATSLMMDAFACNESSVKEIQR